MKPYTSFATALLLAVAACPTQARFLRSSSPTGDNAVHYEETTGSSSSSSPWSKSNPHAQENDRSPETRVVGGTLASRGDFPWFVASTGQNFCGGSLVYEDVMLTAAHCQGAFLPGSRVYVGAVLRDSDREGAQMRIIADEVEIHPDYNRDHGTNDLMLLRLNEPVKDIEPVVLNGDHTYPVDGQALVAMGFGNLAEEGMPSYFLREVELEAFDFDICTRQYNDVANFDGTEALALDPVVQLCAGYSRGGRGTCQGDSGGPLVTKNGVQVGVVSMGVGCARSGFAGIYARVSGAIDFIEQGICKLSSNPPSTCPSSSDSIFRPPF